MSTCSRVQEKCCITVNIGMKCARDYVFCFAFTQEHSFLVFWLVLLFRIENDPQVTVADFICHLAQHHVYVCSFTLTHAYITNQTVHTSHTASVPHLLSCITSSTH